MRPNSGGAGRGQTGGDAWSRRSWRYRKRGRGGGGSAWLLGGAGGEHGLEEARGARGRRKFLAGVAASCGWLWRSSGRGLQVALMHGKGIVRCGLNWG